MHRRSVTRADILQRCLHLMFETGLSLDEVLARYPQEATWLRGELEAARWVALQGKSLQPSEDFLVTSRRRLQQEIARQGHSRVSRQPFKRRQGVTALRFAFALVLVLAVVLASTGVAAASALPGDGLYSLKLSLEQAQLGLTPDLGEKVRLRLRFADERLIEIEALTSQERYEDMSTALQHFRRLVDAARTDLVNLSSDAVRSDLVENLVVVLRRAGRVISHAQTKAPPQLQGYLAQQAMMAQNDLAALGAVGDSPDVGGGLLMRTPLHPTSIFTDTLTPSLTPSPSPTETVSPTATPVETATATATSAPTATATVRASATSTPPPPPPPTAPTEETGSDASACANNPGLGCDENPGAAGGDVPGKSGNKPGKGNNK